ncbi:hypothetical protein CHS0354_036890 [Potamilus streckersoni]|uniref:NmrA-like family domain-containing protein 1 n=1 Tax=Potamilus streckersoni TaxID=2493646 RepID=A0AAE0T268_9BIVA|nr:hypothetical protein CHS0354_036890 [Potamilus streckersoni]
MTSKKIIAVFGATGAQGGAVVRALLQNSSFAVRAVTRNLDGNGAQELKKLKAEVVKGDTDDKEGLKRILSGTYGCFLVTNFLEHFDMNREIQQGKNVADACKAAGIKHLVFSGLDNTEGSGAAGPVHHFDGKAKIEDYIEQIGIPYTSTRVSFYNENFLNFNQPRKTGENKYAISLPMGDKPLYMMTVSDVGPWVVEILKDPLKYKGKKLHLAGDKLTLDQVCATLSKHLKPKQFEYVPIAVEDFAKSSFPGAEEMANMFHFYQLKADSLRDVALTRKLYPKTQTFDAWVQENKEKIIQALK